MSTSGSRTLSARPRPPKPEPEAVEAPLVPEAPAKGQNLQDQFLNLLRRNKTPVTMFLVKGVKLQGIVTWFDNFSILLRRDGQSQLHPQAQLDARLTDIVRGAVHQARRQARAGPLRHAVERAYDLAAAIVQVAQAQRQPQRDGAKARQLA